MSSQDHLTKAFFEESKRTQEKLGEVSEKLGELIQQEAARLEREKIQVEKNKTYDEFTKTFRDEHLPVLQRAKKSQERFDKALVPVLVAFSIAALSALGFNFKG